MRWARVSHPKKNSSGILIFSAFTSCLSTRQRCGGRARAFSDEANCLVGQYVSRGHGLPRTSPHSNINPDWPLARCRPIQRRRERGR
jgi:hypothetical protein